ncbi:hypothetical protein L1887_35586 [Cichorium endivia]|nr:hypothetical protein L1887_35586 [Cichorium endivia]
MGYHSFKDFDEEDDDEYVPYSDESTEFYDDDCGSDMSGVSVDPDENEYVPSTMDKTLVDPFLNDLVQDEMNLPEISSNDEEWSPSNEYNDKGDSEDEETGVQFIGLLEAVKEELDCVPKWACIRGVPPMQFPEVDEGVPLTQEGVSEIQDTVLETQETVPKTQFKQVPVVDVALVEAVS